MAVQKSRRTRSTRGKRRMHDKLTDVTISTDKETGELHLRHHLTANGYYRGKQIIQFVAKQTNSVESSNNISTNE